MMPSPPEIVVYDTPGRDNQIWSHHTLRILYALRHKGLPYTVVPVEYPDIETTFEPTSLAPKDDPVERYEMPVVRFREVGSDADSDEYMMIQNLITSKLDALVPDPPLHFASPRTGASAALYAPFLKPLLQIGVGYVPAVLSERSRTTFLAKREARWGKPLVAWVAERPREMLLATATPHLQAFAKWLEDEEGGGGKGPFIHGSQPGYGDMTIVSVLEYARLVGATGAFDAVMQYPAIARLYAALSEKEGIETHTQ